MMTAKLSSVEVAELLERLSDASRAGVPLADGLTAVADEVANRRVRTSLNAIAQRVSRGEASGPDVLSRSPDLPAELAPLLSAAANSGRWPVTLLQMAELYRGQQQRWQQIRSALAYPLILLILSLALSLLMLKGIWGNLRELIEFDSIEMPVAVHRLNWLEDTGWKYALLLVGVPLLLAVVVRLVGGSWYWTWALSRLPGFGKLILWSGYVEFLSLLRAMLANDVSLPVALRSAALGVRNPVVARSAMQCAERIEQGQSFATSLAAENDIPATLAYLVQWGEANSSLPESLEMATETLESQIRWRVDLLRSVLPPLLFIVTATFAVGMFYLAIAPMQAYLSWLSI